MGHHEAQWEFFVGNFCLNFLYDLFLHCDHEGKKMACHNFHGKAGEIFKNERVTVKVI